MATLTNYRGVEIIDGGPTGAGGAAIQDNFVSLVDWNPRCVWNQSTSPTSSDDQTQNFYPGSFWLQTSTSPSKLFLRQSSATGAAVWVQANSGSVSSVAIANSNGIAVSGSPITSSGTITIGLALSGDVSVASGVATVKSLHGHAVKNVAPTNAQLLLWNSTNTDWEPVSLSGDGTISNAGVISVNSFHGTAFGTAALASVGTSGVTIPLNNGANDFNANTVAISGNGAASVSALALTGSPFTGTGTTSTPLVYINNGAAPTNWSSSGTCLGMNASSCFLGNVLDLRVNGGVSRFAININGSIVSTGNNTFGGTNTFSFGATASNAAMRLSGTLYVGGTGTTTFPQYLAQTAAATAVTSWSTSGAYFGVNANSGFVGNFIDYRVAEKVSGIKSWKRFLTPLRSLERHSPNNQWHAVYLSFMRFQDRIRIVTYVLLLCSRCWKQLCRLANRKIPKCPYCPRRHNCVYLPLLVRYCLPVPHVLTARWLKRPPIFPAVIS
ncbi:autotransporter outer membrane beta-barrel domain-containing protein [Schlesneria paludicola]|uniref:hypothetical protein n=1 Tax=Schlesneria paludicola TaxID=360056 RepID=UPI00029AA220|nr:hypothetical protein [Schlesneria paludicola]